MVNTVTIKFRAKRDEFAGGIGYKVPNLDPNKHLTFTERDTWSQLIKTARDVPAALSRFYKVPGVIWEENTPSQWRSDTSDWTVKPIGNGFMADVSITFPLVRSDR